MVCSATPRLGFVPEVNLARTFLHRAAEAESAGRLYESGCLLREAIMRQLRAMAAWHGCTPTKVKHPREGDYIRALKKAKILESCGAGWLNKMLEVGHHAAHCMAVDRYMLRSAITMLHCYIDESPCGEPAERVAHCKPVTEGYGVDDDDDDAGEAWKAGVQ